MLVKAEPFSHKITDLKMKKYGKYIFQNLKMAADAIDKAKESLTTKNFYIDMLQKVQEVKLKINELEDFANELEIGVDKMNTSDITENDFDTRKNMKVQTGHLKRNLQVRKSNAAKDILESRDMTHIESDNIETDKKLGARLPKCKFVKYNL